MEASREFGQRFGGLDGAAYRAAIDPGDAFFFEGLGELLGLIASFPVQLDWLAASERFAEVIVCAVAKNVERAARFGNSARRRIFRSRLR